MGETGSFCPLLLSAFDPQGMTWTLGVLLGVEGCMEQNGAGVGFSAPAVEHQLPAPTPFCTTALASSSRGL